MFGKRIQYLQGQYLKISAKSPGICSSQTPCQLQCESGNKQQKVYQKREKCQRGRELSQYPKIPKISPGAYIFQRPFLRGLYSEGLMYGGKFAFKNRLS